MRPARLLHALQHGLLHALQHGLLHALQHGLLHTLQHGLLHTLQHGLQREMDRARVRCRGPTEARAGRARAADRVQGAGVGV